MIVLSNVAMNEGDLIDIKKGISEVSHKQNIPIEHSSFNEAYPAVVISIIESELIDRHGSPVARNCVSVCISKEKLLRVLGLSQAQLKIDLSGIVTQEMLDTSEDRDV